MCASTEKIHRVINFAAGPAGLPLPALEQTRDELLDFEGSGMSIMEMSHRGKIYDRVHNEALNLARELLAVPDDYEVLLLQGGASLQFVMLPMNFLGNGARADYIVSGHWAGTAFKQAGATVGEQNINLAASTEELEFRRLPRQDEYRLSKDARYVHMCTNNTIYGTQHHFVPDTGDVPLVADMSSDIMWSPIDVAKYSMIYAGAQKNIGPSGVVLVILKKDFLATAREDLPNILQYKVHAAKNSLFNTPPTVAISLLRNVLAYNKSIGGLKAIRENNLKKAGLLYGYTDANADFYKPRVTEKADRSMMNIDFKLSTPDLDASFIAKAEQAGMVGLKGYRTMGGIRVSAYNAVSVDNVKTLVDFMKDFQARNG